MTAPDRDMMLDRAFILMKRGQHGAARDLLSTLPPDQDVEDMLASITVDQAREKTAQETLRGLRYQLHLDTSARRAWAYLLAVGAAIAGVWMLPSALAAGSAHGFTALHTTWLHAGREGSGPLVPYTRPHFFDVVTTVALILGGAAFAVFVYRVGRGAAQWEELDPSSSPSRSRW